MPAIPALIGAAASIASAKIASNAAKKAAQSGQVDISAIDAQTREMAKRNAAESAELERQLTPEVPALRTAANEAVLNGIGGNQAQRDAAGMLSDRMLQGNGDPFANTPLLKAAIEKARADLAMGGKLSLSQRNEATRAGAAQSGAVSGGLGLGRDLAARDLGLTSYGVEQQRLANATTLGGLEANQNNFSAQNFLQQYGALNSYYNNLRTQDLQAAAYGNSISPPIVGLDPSSAANLAVGNANVQSQANINSANIKAQQGQNLMGFGGQLMGYAAAAYGNGNSGAGLNVPNQSIAGTTTPNYWAATAK